MKNKLAKLWSSVIIAVLLSGILLLTFACGNEDELRLSYMSPQKYEHSSGYQVQIPFNWQLVSKNEYSALFSADQGILSLNIFSEIGGMDYYTPKELGQNIFSIISNLVNNAAVIEELPVDKSDSQYRQLIEGKDAEGNNVYIDVWVAAPYDTVHYYLILICGGDDYEKYRGVYDDIIDRFKVTASKQEIYSYLNSSAREDLVVQYVEQMLEEKSEAANTTENTTNNAAGEDGKEE
jgi:hypothetical protein